MTIQEMLAAFPPDRSWEKGLCRQDPGGPGDCHGLICQCAKMSAETQEVIEFLREYGDRSLIDSETPYQALMNNEMVQRQLRECSERHWKQTLKQGELKL